MALKFAVQEHLIPGETLEAKWALASEIGFAGIELRGEGGTGFADRLAELKAAARAGVAMPTICVITDTFIGDFDADRRKQAIRIMKTLLTVSAEIGGTGAITPAAFGLHSDRLPPFQAPRFASDDRAVLTDMLGLLGDHAASEGVTVLFEPLNRYEDHMVNTLAQAAAICRDVGGSAVKVMADLFHMNIEEADVAQAISDAGDAIAHVHLADSNRLEPGRGHTDFAAAFAALNATGFDGYCAIECMLDQPREIALRSAYETLATACEKET